MIDDIGDIIGELTLAMTHGIGLGKISNTIHPYPTQADAVRKVGDLYNKTRLTPSLEVRPIVAREAVERRGRSPRPIELATVRVGVTGAAVEHIRVCDQMWFAENPMSIPSRVVTDVKR